MSVNIGSQKIKREGINAIFLLLYFLSVPPLLEGLEQARYGFNSVWEKNESRS